MKLTKLHLFLMLLLVLLFSSLGIGVLEGYGIIEGNTNIGDSSVALKRKKKQKAPPSTGIAPNVRVSFKKLGNEKKSMGYGAVSGITKHAIPPGDEHLYVLKSEIVPPVCPKCPETGSSKCKKKKCQPCPPPARCPEPSFTCKKVPNYQASAVDDVLPSPMFHTGEGVQPILTSFANFN